MEEPDKKCPCCDGYVRMVVPPTYVCADGCQTGRFYRFRVMHDPQRISPDAVIHVIEIIKDE